MDKEFMADACLACTSCNAHCPVMNATGEYIGPKLIGPAHLRLNFLGEDKENTLSFCTNCKSCDRTCPSGVRVSTLNMLKRGEYYEEHKHKFRDYILSNHSAVSNIFRSFPFGANIANFAVNMARHTGILRSLGITSKRKLPRYSSNSFTDMLLDNKPQSHSKQVVIFQGCFIEHNAPQVGMAFVKVMEKNGYEVIRDSKFKCCGSPMISAGILDKAKENSLSNAERILRWERKKIPVIALCTSCSLMLKEEAGELFDDEILFMAGKNVYDAFEFLRLLQQKGEFVKPTKTSDETYLYHVPCHLKSQGIGTPAKNILEEVEGLKVKVLETGCCGMAGSYGYQKETADISLKIGEELFNRIREEENAKVISDCATCRMQIEYATEKKAKHPIEILADAYEEKV